MGARRLGLMIITVAIGAVTIFVGCTRSITSAQSAPSAIGGKTTCYPPQYASNGDLILPKNFREWVFVGSPITPNALNGGEARFPEYHNVYIEPCSYAKYMKTNVFPEGTILFKELQLALPAQFPDGSRTELSGRGYFPGPFNGADVSVKDTKRYADTKGWGYYSFNHHEPKAPTAARRPQSECGYCHVDSAKKDDVWTQFYRLLDK